MEQSLEQQREEYRRRRFLAMPLAGSIAWTTIGIAGALLDTQLAALALFVGAGSTIYLGIFISRYTGENFTAKGAAKNTFDILFFQTVAMALLVFAIAIPFFLIEPTSLPLSVGILTGLMWLPLSWMIKHWVGIFHALARTVSILAAWYLFPDNRFVVIPAVIVVTYMVTIVILEVRWRNLGEDLTAAG